MKFISILTCAVLIVLVPCGCNRNSSSASETKSTLNVIHVENHVTARCVAKPDTSGRASTPSAKQEGSPCP